MLYRVAGSPTINGKTQFEDVSSDAYYANAVAWAVEKNITTGSAMISSCRTALALVRKW